MLRRFVLRRTEDISGSSGTGDVASGVVWDDGGVAMRWHPTDPDAIHDVSTAIYRSIESVEKIHGHAGRAKVVWVDD